MQRASGEQEPTADAFPGRSRGPSNHATVNLPIEHLQQGVSKDSNAAERAVWLLRQKH